MKSSRSAPFSFLRAGRQISSCMNQPSQVKSSNDKQFSVGVQVFILHRYQHQVKLKDYWLFVNYEQRTFSFHSQPHQTASVLAAHPIWNSLIALVTEFHSSSCVSRAVTKQPSKRPQTLTETARPQMSCSASLSDNSNIQQRRTNKWVKNDIWVYSNRGGIWKMRDCFYTVISFVVGQ